MSLNVHDANEVARRLDEEMNGAGPRMLAAACRVLVDTVNSSYDWRAAWANRGLGEGSSSPASETSTGGPSHPPKDAA